MKFIYLFIFIISGFYFVNSGVFNYDNSSNHIGKIKFISNLNVHKDFFINFHDEKISINNDLAFKYNSNYNGIFDYDIFNYDNSSNHIGKIKFISNLNVHKDFFINFHDEKISINNDLAFKYNSNYVDEKIINLNLKNKKNIKDNRVISVNYKGKNIIDNYSLPSELFLVKDTKVKKQKFIEYLLPLIIKENQKILSMRSKILEIQTTLNAKNTLDKKNQKYIYKAAKSYHIKTKNVHKIDIIKNLLFHVDIIPNSIVLAQAANESGWGTSRFARDFNALFGQYTYDIDKGIEPQSREDGQKHLVRFFPSVSSSIQSYIFNLNTHPAYKEFRETRNNIRKSNKILKYNILLAKLKGYAADINYIKTINSIIRVNNLYKYDKLISVTTSS